MNKFRRTYKFIFHFFLARHTRGFGVHSPFLFNFTRFVLYDNNLFYSFEAIETLRECLIKDNRLLKIKDYGAGVATSRTIADIAKKSIKPAKQAQLLFRIAHYLKAQNILELGTSLGLTTSYLASPAKNIKCVSLEGCLEIAQVAQRNFEKLGIKNIQLVVGNIDDMLGRVLMEIDQLDLVFIDANHRCESVLGYFDQCLLKAHKDTVIVVDDIYWSIDMEKAWISIKNHPRVTSSIDLFHMGIVFFNADLYKTHYRMRC